MHRPARYLVGWSSPNRARRRPPSALPAPAPRASSTASSCATRPRTCSAPPRSWPSICPGVPDGARGPPASPRWARRMSATVRHPERLTRALWTARRRPAPASSSSSTPSRRCSAQAILARRARVRALVRALGPLRARLRRRGPRRRARPRALHEAAAKMATLDVRRQRLASSPAWSRSGRGARPRARPALGRRLPGPRPHRLR